MRSRPVRKPKETYGDLGSFASNLEAEILDGELVTSCRPGTVQALAASALLGSLGEDEAWSLLGVHEGSAIVRAEPFEALKLELGPLWQR